MTLEAILVFLSKKAVHTNYTTILNDPVRYCIHNNEELRIVYVACTRPKKLLWIAVPKDDIECWRNKLFLEKKRIIVYNRWKKWAVSKVILPENYYFPGGLYQ